VNFTFKNLQNAVATPDELHQNQVVQFRPECNQFISSVGDSDYLPKFHRNPFGIHAKRKQNVAIAYRKRVGSAHKVTTVRGGGYHAEETYATQLVSVAAESVNFTGDSF